MMSLAVSLSVLGVLSIIALLFLLIVIAVIPVCASEITLSANTDYSSLPTDVTVIKGTDKSIVDNVIIEQVPKQPEMDLYYLTVDNPLYVLS